MALSLAPAPRIPHPDLSRGPESRIPRTGHSFFLRVVIGLLVILLSICFLPLRPISAGNIDYVYDELGRLIAVIDETGETAVYQYDAVGNVLSISRQSSAIVSIITFTPSSGPVGTTVTISGTGFSSTLGQNTVAFNGAAAVLTAASFTQLIAQVPAGATTGPINVTTPTGSAASATSFIVADTTTGAPTITGFSPTIGTPGTSVTITGTNFDPVPANDKVAFNTVNHATVSSATLTSISTLVPSLAGSGPISALTPYGKAVSGQDFFVPPSPYTAANVEVTGRMTIGGPSTTVTLSTTNKIALVLFSGTAGQRITLQMLNGTFASAVYSILKPDGTTLATTTKGAGSVFIDAMLLTTTATYTILIVNQGTAPGSVTLTLNAVPPDLTGTITADGPVVTATTTKPGQNARFTFSGTAGKRLTLATTFSNSMWVSVYNNFNGAILVAPIPFTYAGKVDLPALPVDGTYAILVDPTGSNTGQITLTLSSELTGSIAINNTPTTINITRLGQNVRYTFAYTAGQRMSLLLLGGSAGFVGDDVNILSPSGSLLRGFTIDMYGHLFTDVLTLPITATYAIFIHQRKPSTAQLTLTLYAVPDDLTGTISINGPSVTGTITTPGQNARYTFSGAQGQQVNLGLTGVTIPSSTVSLVNPDGSVLANLTVGTSGDSLDPPPLPQPGTYTILIDPNGESTGKLTLTLSSELTGAITLDGPSVTASLTRPGQNARYTFSGAQGQQVNLGLTGVTIPSSTVSLVNPDGSALASLSVGTSGGSLDPPPLPQPGTYAVLVSPTGITTGKMTLTLSTEKTGTITINGASDPLSLRVGQNARLSFNGTQGQIVHLAFSGVTIPSSAVSLYKPDGSQLWNASVTTSGGSFIPPTLPDSGMYTIFIDPLGLNSGNITVTLWRDLSETITADGPMLLLNIPNSGQRALVTFGGSAGQRLGLGLSGVSITSSVVSILKPDGTTLLSKTVTTSGGSLDPAALPVGGTYTILVDPASTNTGNITLTLSTEQTGTITIDGPAVPVSLPRPGQNARYTFTGTVGQRLGLDLAAVTIASSTVSILKPDGTTLVFKTFTTSGGTLNPPAFLVSGTYAIVVDPAGANTGSLTLTLWADITGSLTVNGPAVPVSLIHPSQNARYTFSGTAGQQLGLGLTAVTIASSAVSILKPNGATLVSKSVTASGGSLDPPVLPASGTYTILIDPASTNTGSITLTLSTQLMGTLTINSPASSVSLRPGQNARYTFTGTSGQQVTVRVTGNTLGTVTVKLLSTSGATLATTTSSASSFNLATETLAATGTYTVSIDPSDANTGSLNLSVTSP